jgi:hypothetical protein
MMDNPLVIFDLDRVLHQERRRPAGRIVLEDRPRCWEPRSAPTVPNSPWVGDAS